MSDTQGDNQRNGSDSGNNNGNNNSNPPTFTVPLIVAPNGVDLEQVQASDPDVLFRGAFGTAMPHFSVTLSRTNITSEGNVAGEPVFNFNNIPPFLRDLIENAIRGGEPIKKQATEEVIKHLQIIDPTTLRESESCCSICYEPFDSPNIDSVQDTREEAQRKSEALRERSTEIEGDPGILIPRDATAKFHGELNFIYKKKFNKREQPHKQPEHVPVQMPCKHIFGRSCLVEWLKSNISCPLCRREVESQPVGSGSSSSMRSPAESRAQSLIMNRAFCPADWASSELSSDDPAIPYPMATNSRRSGRTVHGRTVIHFTEPTL
jgi:hypothetical protein